jgi:hypothetical protein
MVKVLKEIVDYLIVVYGLRIDTLITVSITISVFLAGQSLSEFFKFLTKNRKRKLVRKIFSSNLNTYHKQIKNQSEIYAETASELSIKSSRAFVLRHNTLFQKQHFYAVGYQEVFDSYIRKINKYSFLLKVIKFFNINNAISKRKHNPNRMVNIFNKTWTIFETIEFFNKYSIELMEKRLVEFNILNSKRNEELDSLIMVIQNYEYNRSIGKIPQVDGDLLSEFAKIFNEWVAIEENERVRPDVTNHKFIIPAIELCRSNPDSKISLEIIRSLRIMRFQFKEMENLIQNTSIYFRYTSIRFGHYSKIIDLCNKALN